MELACKGVDIIDFLNSIFPIILSAIVAISTGFWALYQHRKQSILFKTEMYYKFQERFREFQKLLPPDFNERDKKGLYTHDLEDLSLRRNVEIYWHIVFDEWFLCCKINKSMKILWREYYEKGVQQALTINIFILAFRDFIIHNDTLLGHKDEFIKEIERLCHDETIINSNIHPTTKECL